jgi:hypothetical protein
VAASRSTNSVKRFHECDDGGLPPRNGLLGGGEPEGVRPASLMHRPLRGHPYHRDYRSGRGRRSTPPQQGRREATATRGFRAQTDRDATHDGVLKMRIRAPPHPSRAQCLVDSRHLRS